MAVVMQPQPVIVQAAPVIQPVAIVPQPLNQVVIQCPMKSVPAQVKCSYCQQQVVTIIKPVNGVITWVIAGTLFVFGVWPFCVIPFFVKSCKDVQHTCPQCKNVITVYKRM